MQSYAGRFALSSWTTTNVRGKDRVVRDQVEGLPAYALMLNGGAL